MKKGEYLYKKLKNYLKPDDTILDYCCGFSPIASHMVNDYKYIGFDYNLELIEKCRQEFPNGEWHLKRYEALDYTDIDVLMFLSSTFHPYILRYFKQNIKTIMPRIILVDISMFVRIPSRDVIYTRETPGLPIEYLQLNIFLIKNGYKIIEHGKYGRPSDIGDPRFFQIWRHDGI